MPRARANGAKWDRNREAERSYALLVYPSFPHLSNFYQTSLEHPISRGLSDHGCWVCQAPPSSSDAYSGWAGGQSRLSGIMLRSFQVQSTSILVEISIGELIGSILS